MQSRNHYLALLMKRIWWQSKKKMAAWVKISISIPTPHPISTLLWWFLVDLSTFKKNSLTFFSKKKTCDTENLVTKPDYKDYFCVHLAVLRHLFWFVRAIQPEKNYFFYRLIDQICFCNKQKNWIFHEFRGIDPIH